MARRRYLSTEISLDARVDQLATEAGDFAVLLYTWMIPHADDSGRVTSCNARELKARVIPHRTDKTPDDVQVALDVMERLGLIEREGLQYYFPPNAFYRYQTYISEEKRRKERPTPKNAAKRRETAKKAASLSLSPSLSSSPSSTSTLAPSESLPSALHEPAEHSTPDSGSNGKTRVSTGDADTSEAAYECPYFAVTNEQITFWRQSFPGVDIVPEIRHAMAWIDANPDRRKTPRGWKRFLVGWLSRNQDRSRGRPPSGPRLVTTREQIQQEAESRRGAR